MKQLKFGKKLQTCRKKESFVWAKMTTSGKSVLAHADHAPKSILTVEKSGDAIILTVNRDANATDTSNSGTTYSLSSTEMKKVTTHH